ncbi:MAG: PEP-CTERM sorting domain-containing protein [Gemmatimonadota bacterium]
MGMRTVWFGTTLDGYGPSTVMDSYELFDLTFEEFSSGPTDATPEPASLVLIGTGLLGIASFARRSQTRIS